MSHENSAVWCTATVCTVLIDGWFSAKIQLPDASDEWEDWFHWREEGTDWRRFGLLPQGRALTSRQKSKLNLIGEALDGSLARKADVNYGDGRLGFYAKPIAYTEKARCNTCSGCKRHSITEYDRIASASIVRIRRSLEGMVSRCISSAHTAAALSPFTTHRPPFTAPSPPLTSGIKKQICLKRKCDKPVYVVSINALIREKQEMQAAGVGVGRSSSSSFGV